MPVFFAIILFFNSHTLIATILTFFCYYSQIMHKKNLNSQTLIYKNAIIKNIK